MGPCARLERKKPLREPRTRSGDTRAGRRAARREGHAAAGGALWCKDERRKRFRLYRRIDPYDGTVILLADELPQRPAKDRGQRPRNTQQCAVLIAANAACRTEASVARRHNARMNWARIAGRWKQPQGIARQRWSRTTGNYAGTAGKREQCRRGGEIQVAVASLRKLAKAARRMAGPRAQGRSDTQVG